MIYQKSYAPVPSVGSKSGDLERAFTVGHKAVGHLIRLGEKTKRFYEKYGSHMPQPVAEKARELEPYFNKGMDAAKKVKHTLEKAKRHHNKGGSSEFRAPSAGAGSRPEVLRRPLDARHQMRVRNRSSQDVFY